VKKNPRNEKLLKKSQYDELKGVVALWFKEGHPVNVPS